MLPGLHLRRNGLLEIGDHPGDGVLQAFCQRQLLDGHIGIKGCRAGLRSSFRCFQNLRVAKWEQIDYNAPVLERHTPTKEEKTMRFNFCNIWQLLCQLGGFGC